MKVWCKTKYGNIAIYWYDAGKPDRYGNANEPVTIEGESGQYCPIYWN